MAKKAKKAKKTKKTAKAGPKEKTVRMEAVVRFVQRLEELNHLDEFLELVRGSKSFVTLRGRSHDVVKRFVEQKRAGATTSKPAGVVAKALASMGGGGAPIDPCPKGFRCF
jgi:hypothetical protein